MAGEQAQGAFGGLDGQLTTLSEQTARAAGEQQQFATAAAEAGRQAQGAYGAAGSAATDAAALARMGFEEAAAGVSTLVSAAGEARSAMLGIGSASSESAGVTLSVWERTGVVMGGIATTSTEAAVAQQRLGEASTVGGDAALSSMMQVERTLGLVATSLERLTALETTYGDTAAAAGNKAAAAHERAAVTGGGGGGREGPVSAAERGGLAGFFGGGSRAITTTIGTFAAFELGQKAVERLIDVSKEAFHGAQLIGVALNQSDIIFGTFSHHVIDNTEQLANKFGFSNARMLVAADSIGKVGQSMGLTQQEAAHLATNFEPVIGAVARFKNTDIETVATAFQRGLLGMQRGLKVYGVQLDDTHLHQAALELGIAGTKKEWDNAELVQIRARAIMDQLTSVTDNLAKSQDTLAGRLAQARGHLENWLEAAGHAATPALLGFFDGLGSAIHQLGPFFSSLGETAGHVGTILGDLAQEFGPLLGALSAVAATGVIDTLNGIGSALAATTGFLAHNKTLVEALAIAYAVSLAPALAEAITKFAGLAALHGIAWLDSAGTAVRGLAGSFITLADAETVAGGAAVTSAAEQTAASGSLLATLGRIQIGWAGVGLAAGVAFVAAQHFFSEWQSQGARQVSDKFPGLPSTASLDDMRKRLGDLARERARLSAQLNEPLGSSPSQQLQAEMEKNANAPSLGSALISGRVAEQARLREELTKTTQAEAAQLRDYRALQGGIQMASKQTGLSMQATQTIAESANLDLSKGAKAVAADIEKVAAASRLVQQTSGVEKGVADEIALAADKAGVDVKKLSQALYEASQKSGVSEEALLRMSQAGSTAMDDPIAKAKALGDEIAKAGDAAGKAWSSSFDIIGKLGSAFAAKDIFGIDALAHPQTPTGDMKGDQAQLSAARATDSHTAAVDRLTAAQQRLHDIQSKPGTSPATMIAAQNAVAAAQRAVATSATAMGLAQEKAATAGTTASTKTKDAATLTAAGVEQVFNRATEVGSHLITTMQIAIQRGLNPQAVQQIMTMPVEQAQPVLDALVSDASGGVIRTLNKDTALLDAWGVEAVRMARLTQIAIAAKSEDITNDLSLSMRIDQMEWASGGSLTAQALATNLGVKVEDVGRVVAEYGLKVQGGIGDIVTLVQFDLAHGLAPGTSANAYANAAGAQAAGRAAGTVLSTQWGQLPVEHIGPGFVDNRPRAVVSEGGSHPEYVIPTDPKYAHRARPLAAALLQDLGMAHHESTHPRHMASGGTLTSHIPQQPQFGPKQDFGGSGHFATDAMYFLAVSGVQKAMDAFGKWMQGASAASVTPPAGTVPGNVAQWLQLAIALTHVPSTWLGPLEVIAMHESGGDPHSHNDWDINAQQGNPSWGLMQTTISTFNSNALPGHGDIWNPVDNAAAAIRYIQGKYHDISNVPGVRSMAAGGPYKPYAAGGILDNAVAMLASGGVVGGHQASQLHSSAQHGRAQMTAGQHVEASRIVLGDDRRHSGPRVGFKAAVEHGAVQSHFKGSAASGTEAHRYMAFAPLVHIEGVGLGAMHTAADVRHMVSGGMLPQPPPQQRLHDRSVERTMQVGRYDPHHTHADPSSAFLARPGGLPGSRVGEGKAAERWMHEPTVRLPHFDYGGTMPGTPGTPGLAVLHGGEHVVTPQQVAQPVRVGAPSGATIVNNINVPLEVKGPLATGVTPADLQRAVNDTVVPEMRKAAERYSAGVLSTR